MRGLLVVAVFSARQWVWRKDRPSMDHHREGRPCCSKDAAGSRMRVVIALAAAHILRRLLRAALICPMTRRHGTRKRKEMENWVFGAVGRRHPPICTRDGRRDLSAFLLARKERSSWRGRSNPRINLGLRSTPRACTILRPGQVSNRSSKRRKLCLPPLNVTLVRLAFACLVDDVV